MKTKIIIIACIAILVAIGIIIGIFAIINYKPAKISNEYFSLTPNDWIENNDNTDEEGDYEVNVFMATRGKAEVDLSQEDYRLNKDIVSFFYHGSYQGQQFRSAYLEEEFYNISAGKSRAEQETLAKQYTKMKIGPNMDPNDGIMEAFILAKIEKNAFVFYLFVDEDWKNKIKSTNILYGENLGSPTIRQFDFSNSKNGIYIDKIDEPSFYQGINKGGIFLGEIDNKVLQSMFNQEEINNTFIFIR